MMVRFVASPWSQPAESVIPKSMAVVVRRIREAALGNGTSKSTLDQIEVKYQHALVLRCAAGLQFPPLTVLVTSPIISHAMSISGMTQQMKVAGYQSVGVTSVLTSYSGSLSATGSLAHEDCSHRCARQT